MQNIMGGDTTASSLALLQSTERTDKKAEGPAPKAGPKEEELRQLFDSIDTDGGGTLDREELAVLATKLGQALGPAELETFGQAAARPGLGRTVKALRHRPPTSY